MAQPNQPNGTGGQQNQPFTGFPMALARPPMQQQQQSGLNQAQNQHLNIAGRGGQQQAGMQQANQAGGQGGAAHLQQMIMAMQSQQQQQHLQMQPQAMQQHQTQQQQQFYQAHQQQQQAQQAQQQAQHPSMNMNALAELVRQGQLSAEQFQSLAKQMNAHNQAAQLQAATRAASVQPQQPMRPAPPNPLANPSAPTNFFAGQNQQNQQLQQQTQPPPNLDPSERIPYALLAPHMQQMHIARNLQTKIVSLASSLSTGMMGSAEPGMGTPITQEQRGAMEKQMQESRGQLSNAMVAVTAFQNQWGNPKILADWNHYNQVNQLAQRRAQQQLQQQHLQQNQPPQQSQPPQHQLQNPLPPTSLPLPLSLPLSQPGLAPTSLNYNNGGNPAALSAAGGAMLQAQLMQAAQRSGAAGKLPMPLPGQPPQPRMDQASLGLGGPPGATQNGMGGGNGMGQGQGQSAGQQMGAQQQANGQIPPLHLLQTQLDPKVFMKSLFEVMRKRGEPITGTPFIDEREVDLYQLYQAVMLMGGSKKVNQTAAWLAVVKQLGWATDTDDPSQVQHLAQQLASLYQRLLYPFEEVWQTSLLKQQKQLFEARRKTLAGGANGAPVNQPPSTAAMAGMTPGQLLSYGFNPTQVEFMKSQTQAPTAAMAMAQAPIVAPSPQTQAANLGQNQQKPQGMGTGMGPQTTLKAFTAEPSLEQMSEARSIVTQLRASTEQNKSKLKFLTMSEEEKARVAALTHDLIPIVKKVHEVLPLFLAMSNDTASVGKILTMAALFNDQIKYLATGQFALSMTGLEQLRDQFHRCWGFVKQNFKSRDRTASDSSAPAAPVASTSALPKDQFSLMVSRNTALRVEDLKPPPGKHRRTMSTSAQSPQYASPNFPNTPRFETGSPQTPQTDADSPPKSEAQSRAKAAKAPVKPRKKEPVPKAVARKVEIKDSPSPRTSSLQSGPPPVEEEQLSLKRKRDQSEIEQDPDAYIERTLRGLSRPLGESFQATDLTSHLPFDFDPVIPAVQDMKGMKPLSFSVLSSGDGFASERPTALARPVAPQTPAFDFDFFIDSTAAGFDFDPPETPELIGGVAGPTPNDEASPPSDDEDNKMMNALANYSTSLHVAPLYTPAGEANDTLSVDYEKFLVVQAVTPGFCSFQDASRSSVDGSIASTEHAMSAAVGRRGHQLRPGSLSPPIQYEPILRVVETSQTFEVGGPENLSAKPIYINTIVLLESDTHYYVHKQTPQDVDVALIGIPSIQFAKVDFCPLLTDLPALTPLYPPIPPETFIKYPSPHTLDEHVKAETVARGVQCEIKLWETILRHHPSPRICEYRGVISQDGVRATGIALKDYGSNLAELAERKVDLGAVDKLMEELETAIAHIHSLGLVHFCFHTSKTSTILEIDVAKKGLRMLAEAGMKKLNVAGGEPFTKPRFLGEIIRFCKVDLGLESISIIFLDCSGGGKVPGRSLLDVGVTQALEDAGFDQQRFLERGGVFDWQKVKQFSDADSGHGYVDEKLKW
ncbi:hypothetical protein P7C70_g6366, partial [Phenoliferia sp. Uapishka_3]